MQTKESVDDLFFLILNLMDHLICLLWIFPYLFHFFCSNSGFLMELSRASSGRRVYRFEAVDPLQKQTCRNQLSEIY